MLLDDDGLNIGMLSPALADVIGNSPDEEGSNVLVEAVLHGRGSVQCRDWLYCLAKSPATHVRRTLVDGYGSQPERFIDAVEQGIDDGASIGIPPERLTAQTVAPDVLRALDWAEGVAREKGLKEVNDALLTLAFVKHAGRQLTEILELWAGEDGLRAFVRLLELEIGPEVVVEPFGADGSLNQSAFSPGGRRFCNRLVEEAASLGVRKVTTRHMLYTLLGNESGLLTIALTVRGVNVKRDLHALLVRELTRPGRKRSDGLTLRSDTVFDAVRVVLKHAIRLARERGTAAAGESEVARALLKKQGSEVTRLFPPEIPPDLSGLIEYMDASDHSEEEEARDAIRRYSISEIRQNINRRIVGQETAVEEILPLIKRLHFGLPRDGRPAGVFLFLGPTGTGKTQLAKELARYVYGDEEMMIYLEMGQFQAKEAINSFIGAPPGYVGYGDGKLTNGLRDKPECVVLFDEIEKAETQVFDALLRFADEGVISDPAGPVRDGRRCIIVMTTNAGQEWLRAHLGASPGAFHAPEELARDLFAAAAEELRARGFRVEFLGRVDKLITFLPFTRESYRRIVDNVIEAEADKFMKYKGVTVEVTQAARALIAELAFEQSLDVGARGAPRAVNDLVVSPVIDALTSDEAGGDFTATRIVAVVGDSGGIELEIQNGHGTEATAAVTSGHEA